MMRSLESGSGVSQEDIARSIPLGRYAEGEDIANMVLFLASENQASLPARNSASMAGC